MDKNQSATAEQSGPPDIHDEEGRVTRAGAEHVIKSGGSVLVGGRLYNSLEKLPSEADFAKGSSKGRLEARARLRKQMINTQAQLAELDAEDEDHARQSAATTGSAARPTQQQQQQIGARSGAQVQRPPVPQQQRHQTQQQTGGASTTNPGPASGASGVIADTLTGGAGSGGSQTTPQ